MKRLIQILIYVDTRYDEQRGNWFKINALTKPLGSTTVTINDVEIDSFTLGSLGLAQLIESNTIDMSPIPRVGDKISLKVNGVEIEPLIVGGVDDGCTRGEYVAQFQFVKRNIMEAEMTVTNTVWQALEGAAADPTLTINDIPIAPLSEESAVLKSTPVEIYMAPSGNPPKVGDQLTIKKGNVIIATPTVDKINGFSPTDPFKVQFIFKKSAFRGCRKKQ